MGGKAQSVLIASLAASGLLSAVLSAGSQNPWGQASNQQLNSGGSHGSQNPWGNTGAAQPPPVNQNPFGNQRGQQQQRPLNQNPFGNTGNTGGQPQPSNQNPFGNTGGQGQQQPSNQNPFGNTGGQQQPSNQNPFGNTGGQQQPGNSQQNPSGGNSGGQQQPSYQNPPSNTGGQQQQQQQQPGNAYQNPSGGSQNPSGGSSSGPASQGSTGPLVNGVGCPPSRAQEPTPGLTNSLNYASSPVCPHGDGQLYQSPDGATFFMQCCSHGHSSPIKTFIASDFRSCMDECSKTDTCQSIQYVAHPRTSEPHHECKLYSAGGFSNTKCADDQHNYAYIIDPPAIDSPDLATIMCSRECPYADGQQFTTDSGEAFRMDCGVRHGTRVIYQDTQNSLEECVQACGNLMACHSVDYDSRRKTCYYGNHQGAPTIKAPSFGSAYSMGCGGACDKKSCCGGCGKKK